MGEEARGTAWPPLTELQADYVAGVLDAGVEGFDRYRDRRFEGGSLLRLGDLVRDKLKGEEELLRNALVAELRTEGLPVWAADLMASRVAKSVPITALRALEQAVAACVAAATPLVYPGD